MTGATDLQVIPVTGIGEVRPGDDLAALVHGAAGWLRDGDVLVVTSKVVSKAEGRLVDLPGDEPGRAAALEAALVAETARVVARRGPVRIVQTHHGFVMAAAGIDNSNVDPSRIVLLPKDPDASARALRAALRERFGRRVAVVISDTMGRTWRNGQTDVAVGAAGIAPIRDHRGQIDPYGNELQVTEIAVVDQVAGAAELVKGKFARVPAAVVRGLGLTGGEPDGPGVTALVRDAALDLFTLGSAEARAAGLRDAATLADAAPLAPGPDAAVAAAIKAVAGAVAPGTRFATAAVVRGHEITVSLAAGVRPDVAAVAAGDPAGAAAGITPRVAAGAAAGVTPGDPAGAAAGITPRVAAGDPAGAEAPAGAAGLVRLGADVHRLRVALAAEGLVSTVLSIGPPAIVLAGLR